MPRGIPKKKEGPRTTCPFSGEKLHFVETVAGWQVRGKGWSSTKFYKTREDAEWEFSHDEGKAPNMEKPWHLRVTVGEETVPKMPESVDQLKTVDKMSNEFSGMAQTILETGKLD